MNRFLIVLLRYFWGTIINLIILLIIGGLAGLLTFEITDYFSSTSKGVNNIPILISAFSFFPLLTSLFVIFLRQESKRKKRKKIKNEII